MRKKTLFISSRPGSDFSMDLLFAGFVGRLGPENVVDYPAHEKHRRRVVLTGDPEKDYGLERGSLCYTPRNCEVPELDDDEILRLLAAGEVERVFVDERNETFVLYRALGCYRFDVPVVVVAGHDRFWNVSPEHVRSMYLGRLEAMFIDDWQPEYDALPYAHLINLSINYDHLWDPSRREELLRDKRYDICFVGYNSTPERAMVVDHIEKRWGHLDNHIVLERRPDTFDRFVRHRELFETMARSRICLNLPGASVGGRALRYYEIPYVGSCMLSRTFPARLLHPFVDGVHCCYFETLGQLDRSIEYLLENEEVRESIARNGHVAAMSLHTVKARIDYVYDILEKR